MIIYADCNSGRPMYPEVAEKISTYSLEHLANPSQILSPMGKKAKELIELACFHVSQLVDCKPGEVVFTSGATESCFDAILGASLVRKNKNKIISSRLEHAAVSEACNFVSNFAQITNQQVNLSINGEVDEILESIDDDTFLVNLIAANNETGICYHWQALKQRAPNIIFHSDMTQWIGKLPFSFRNSSVDLVSFSSHKIGGPQGVGALIVREGINWLAPMLGGGQQQGRRGGTENVLGIIGFGEAARITKNMELANSEVRDSFENALTDPEIVGKNSSRIPNTTMLILKDLAANDLVLALAQKGITISSGSACSQGAGSRVLQAMGYSERESRSAVRISFLAEATIDQAQHLATQINTESERLRKINIEELRKIYE